MNMNESYAMFKVFFDADELIFIKSTWCEKK